MIDEIKENITRKSIRFLRKDLLKEIEKLGGKKIEERFKGYFYILKIKVYDKVFTFILNTYLDIPYELKKYRVNIHIEYYNEINTRILNKSIKINRDDEDNEIDFKINNLFQQIIEFFKDKNILRNKLQNDINLYNKLLKHYNSKISEFESTKISFNIENNTKNYILEFKANNDDYERCCKTDFHLENYFIDEDVLHKIKLDDSTYLYLVNIFDTYSLQYNEKEIKKINNIIDNEEYYKKLFLDYISFIEEKISTIIQ